MVNWKEIALKAFNANIEERKELDKQKLELKSQIKQCEERYEELTNLVKKAVPCRTHIFSNNLDNISFTQHVRNKEPMVRFCIDISIGEARYFAGGNTNLVETVGEMVKREIIAEILKRKDTFNPMFISGVEMEQQLQNGRYHGRD
ncbi:MAG TPA: hypothetical protein VMX17_11690 [Candidatus Glassbacteria bacterium]|nr:hypothetical protein [Candidatus Glassbacteria bacterium]